jgi:serine/threonine protein kinase
MSEITNPKCPQCGAEMPGGSTGRVCPRCAAAFLKAAPTEMSGGSAGPPRAFTPPPVAELTPLFPQLEILELIGQGGMGAVYKARQKELDRIVALKILPPGVGGADFAERFAREAKALARLNHPGIVTIYEFGRSNGLFFFLMEFVDGVTLRQVLHGGRISPREALAIVPAICDALQYAHDEGIVHRDIKPENILLDRRGRTKVADFGLAKLMESGNADSNVEASTPGVSSATTHASKVLGTPQYMSPEQIEHPGTVDHRADIYALGVVFYQMLTGEMPGQRVEPPSHKVQIDVRLDEVVLRALEKNPALRYPQASALKTDVETIALTGEKSASAPRLPRSSGVEQSTIQELAQLLAVPVGEPSRRAARIQAVERDIVLPLRLMIIAIIGYYLFFSGWLDNSRYTRAWEDWTMHYAQSLKDPFVICCVINVIFGAVLIWARNLSLMKIQWMLFAMGVLDALTMGALTGLTNGFDSNLYWVFAVLIVHNAMAIPGAFPQLLLNVLTIGAFVAGGRLDHLLTDITGVEANSVGNSYERVVVLAAWALCCFGVQMLLQKQKRADAGAGEGDGAKPSNGQPARRAETAKIATLVCAAAGVMAALAFGFGWHLLFKSPGPFEGGRSLGPVQEISATTARKGDIGERLQSLGTVESSNSVCFAIAENYCQEVIRKFDAHQVLTVEASNSQGEKFGHGFLSGVDNLIDRGTGTLKCRATLVPEGENLMIPGRLLNISLLLDVKHGVTLVPTADMQRDPQSAFVWVIQGDHTVTRRAVRVGTMDGNWTEIQSGLSPGEVVAGSGFDLLAEGQKVRFDLAQAEPAHEAAKGVE